MEANTSPIDATLLAPTATSELWLHRYAYRPQAVPASVNQHQPRILLEQVPALLGNYSMR